MDDSTLRGRSRADLGPLSARESRFGVGALLGVKLADLLTTVAGLRLSSPVRELNPLAATVIDSAGLVPGLLALAVVSVACVVLVTEGAVTVLAYRGDGDRLVYSTVRTVGYGLPILVSIAVVTHNVLVLARV